MKFIKILICVICGQKNLLICESVAKKPRLFLRQSDKAMQKKIRDNPLNPRLSVFEKPRLLLRQSDKAKLKKHTALKIREIYTHYNSC